MSTAWLNNSRLSKLYPEIKHVMINYDTRQICIDMLRNNTLDLNDPLIGNDSLVEMFITQVTNNFTHVISDNTTLTESNNVFISPRAIPCMNTSILDGTDNITIGFQGFILQHKGIERLANQIKKEFNNATFRIHAPIPHNIPIITRNTIIDNIKKILENTNIKLEITEEYLNDNEIVEWLSKNTINCYFYDELKEHAIASSPDYAISSGRPIAISKSYQFRHMWDLTPSILIEERSLKEIINSGIEPLIPLYESYSHKNFITKYEDICNKLLFNASSGSLNKSFSEAADVIRERPTLSIMKTIKKLRA